jgi:23S rRNA A1618 N6-methylase RlmF
MVCSVKRYYEILPCSQKAYCENAKKLALKEWTEELENFKKVVIEIIDPLDRTTKALEKFHKVKNMNYKALRDIEMTKHGKICKECDMNWHANNGRIREGTPNVPKCEGQRIRFSDSREISILGYFSSQKKSNEK